MTWMHDDLADRTRRKLHRRRRRILSGQGPRVTWRGREFVNFASNDYLGLASDPRLARASAQAARRYGTGSGASALVTGHLPPLRALERELAAWEGTEAALVFSSGFAANLAVVSSLTSRRDAVFSDELNHASLIDGCRLSRADVHIFRHNDMEHLNELLHRFGPKARRRLIVADSLFSMDGDLAPLDDLSELAQLHGAMLLLDEAHATGVLGEHGQGAADSLSMRLDPPEHFIKMGTLSKALGSQGGFVCGTRVLIDWLVNHARPYVFSTALAPPSAAAARCAVRIARDEKERRWQVLTLADSLRSKLQKLGADVGSSTTHIVPVIAGSPQRALAWSRRLEERGLLVPAIRPPSVPAGTSRLRIGVSAGHTAEDIDLLVSTIGEVLGDAAEGVFPRIASFDGDPK